MLVLTLKHSFDPPVWRKRLYAVNKWVGTWAPDQLHQNPKSSRTDSSSNPHTISHNSLNLQNNVSRQLLYNKSDPSCSRFPCRNHVGILAWKWRPTSAPYSYGFEFQCWLQSPELLRSSCRHLWRCRWDIRNAYSNIPARVPLWSGHDEVVAEIFATPRVYTTFPSTIYRELIQYLSGRRTITMESTGPTCPGKVPAWPSSLLGSRLHMRLAFSLESFSIYDPSWNSTLASVYPKRFSPPHISLRSTKMISKTLPKNLG